MKLKDEIFLTENGFDIIFANAVIVNIIWNRRAYCNNNVHFLTDKEFRDKVEKEDGLFCETIEVSISNVHGKPLVQTLFKDFLKKYPEYDGGTLLCYLPVKYIPYILTECQNCKTQ
jgi:hypothetical protein